MSGREINPEIREKLEAHAIHKLGEAVSASVRASHHPTSADVNLGRLAAEKAKKGGQLSGKAITDQARKMRESNQEKAERAWFGAAFAVFMLKIFGGGGGESDTDDSIGIQSGSNGSGGESAGEVKTDTSCSDSGNYGDYGYF